MSNLIDPTSTESRVPKVVQRRQVRHNGRLKNVNSLMDAHMAGVRHHHPCVYTQSFRSCPAGLLEGSARYSGRIESSATHRCRVGGVIRIEITLASQQTLAPVWSWFDRISWRSSSGSSHCTTAYSDSLQFMLNEYTTGQLASILPVRVMLTPLSPHVSVQL